MTTMSVPVGGEIGLEVHHDTDQFIRVEAGAATVHIGATKDTLQEMGEAVPGYGIFVPTGMWHNIINSGDVPLQVYSIYAPAHHPRNTVHETFADAVAAEEIHD
jgi:mannose-6-phosphate isomerase-like protein (cupin superfamily)